MREEEVEELLVRVGKSDPELAIKLRQAMFSFEELKHADIVGLQKFLPQIAGATLRIALRRASPELKARIYSAMSKRAAALLADEVSLMPPMPVSQIEACEEEICDLARSWIAEGKLHIPGRGEPFV
jgi:flagellar motor switch protein FliG